MAKVRKENTDRLLELYYSGRLDDESKEIVQGWLSDSGNRESKEANMAMMFEKIVNGNRKPDEYTRRSLAVIQEELGFTERTSGRSRIPLTKRISFRLTAAAATAAAAVLIGLFILPDRTGTPVPDEFAKTTVITSEQDTTENIVLPDGSVIRPKEATIIAYADNFAENRKVRIDGEAYFIVAHDPEHPFTVEGADVVVTVIGTEFNMKAYESDNYAEVILTTGKIAVVSGDARITLDPAEKATVDRRRHMIERDEIMRGELLRLRGLNLTLEDVSLDEAFRQIGAYYGATINLITNVPDMDGIIVKLDGSASLHEALILLQAVNPVFNYRIDGDTVTITGRQ